MDNNTLLKLREAAKAAYLNEQQTRIPCQLTIAQWALESGWGEHCPGNNCFGIKNYAKATGKQLLHTTEYFPTPESAQEWVEVVEGRTAEISEDVTVTGRVKYDCQDWFATFESTQACFYFRSYAILLKGAYARELEYYIVKQDLISYIHNIAGIYATDPTYATKIKTIMSMPEVVAALAEAAAS